MALTRIVKAKVFPRVRQLGELDEKIEEQKTHVF